MVGWLVGWLDGSMEWDCNKIYGFFVFVSQHKKEEIEQQNDGNNFC